MSEGFEPFHVPQQSRRDKLRISTSQHHHQQQPPMLPFYDHHSYLINQPINFIPFISSSSTDTTTMNPNFPFDLPPLPTQGGLSLSLSSERFGGLGDALPRTTSSVPLGPFTGYATILKGSRFLRPAQQLLEELCEVVGRRDLLERSDGESSSMVVDPLMDDGGIVDVDGDRQKKTRLMCMLDEVYRRYKQYYHQLQTVMASFESVAGLSTAAPYTSLALKAMSKHFHSLKNAITDQLRCTSKALGENSYDTEDHRMSGLADGGLRNQRPPRNSGSFDVSHAWRPQRGLPERAVSVLRAWLFEHFLHPYPTDRDKQMLAKETGLSRNQVSNWFINARVRLWKPMVEEIHSLELRQAQNLVEGDDCNASKQGQSSTASDRLSAQTLIHPKHQDPSLKIREDDLLNRTHSMGVGASVSGGGNGGVSLTLGLRQNNGGCLPESLPMNVARRFGLEDSEAAYVLSGYEAPSRHFTRDVIGGQLLHDYAGEGVTRI
ncbi:BEL1-like homeodomain protein 9 [Acorus gramineus]|uniref:BEL1-like homeodomain protein 9 n=1 Tax=Acorus gramineus TaxID=55184 RepID=A0AAV9B0W0_ACOGR|nr:BEL1-like homeodomain protein 9 [Acorus gramineus]